MTAKAIPEGMHSVTPHLLCAGAAGGKICIEEQKVPGMGSFSLFTDPEGRMMGLWKAAKQR